jgi:hypothetical protein
VLESAGQLCRRTPEELERAIEEDRLLVHPAVLRGALPALKK